MRHPITVVAVAALTLFAACMPTNEQCVRLPNKGRYCLVAGRGPEFAAEQTSTVSFRGKTLRLIARIASGRDSLHIASLSPLGQTLFQVSWENSTLRAEMPSALDGQVDAALFPALLQIATWPAEHVRKGLSEGLELIEEPGRRVIRSGPDDVLVVSWEGNQLPYARLRIEAPMQGLTIDSRTLEAVEMDQ